MTLAGRAYVLKNQVVHIRYLPTPSKHAFVYPTSSLLLSLNDLEQGELDLTGGWVFGFGSIRDRLAGLRASGYLQNTGTSGKSIREKLVALLDQRGFNGALFHNAWILTIPALFGIEVINPLTVYFCYKSASSALWLVVLEVTYLLNLTMALSYTTLFLGAQHIRRKTCLHLGYRQTR